MKSLITEAKVTKRFNLGDYEHEEYTLGAVVDERESGAQVLRELKLQIGEAFKGEAEAPATEETTTTPPKKEKKNGKAKPSDSDDKSNDADDSGDETPSDDGEGTENDADANDAADDSSDGDADGEEDRKSSKGKAGKEKSAKEGKSKGFKAKPQNYNRAIEQHKEIFSKLLGSVMPDWKKKDSSKMLAKNTSAEMEGEEFLDANGEVLPAFKAAVVKHMKAKK